MNSSATLALDVGERRIGVAVAGSIAKIAHPLTTIDNTDAKWEALKQIIEQEEVTQLVVGLPRGLDGQETAQTAYVRQFVTELQSQIDLPVALQDEALTSREAEKRLGDMRNGYNKAMVDAEAAAIILDDYIRGGDA